MRAAVTGLYAELPTTLGPNQLKTSPFGTFRNGVVALSNAFPETVDAEALFVRLLYLRLRMVGQGGRPLDDAGAIRQILTYFAGQRLPPQYDLTYRIQPRTVTRKPVRR
jgi:hypothetical protein